MIETVSRLRVQDGQRPGVFTCWLGVNSAHAARQRFLAQRIPYLRFSSVMRFALLFSAGDISKTGSR